MSERFKELVLKTSDTERYRGFESYSLRQRSGVYLILYQNTQEMGMLPFRGEFIEVHPCTVLIITVRSTDNQVIGDKGKTVLPLLD